MAAEYDPLDKEMGGAMATKPEISQGQSAPVGTRIKWDDSNMKSAYANVCNAAGTREEVVMRFGMNQAWNRGPKEVTHPLSDSIVVGPYAAKRVSSLLDLR